MARKKTSKHLDALIELLLKDGKGKFGNYPDQAIYALHDSRVTAALERRFEDGLAIKAIRALHYDFYTGLHNIVFEFAPGMMNLVASKAGAILVILDGHCQVIGLVDPFDPIQPNKYVPPLPENVDGEQPFVLDRPAMAQCIGASDEKLYPVQVRNRAFFQRLQSSLTGSQRGGPIIIIIEWPVLTVCTFSTWTPWYGTVTDVTLDDSGKDPDIWA